MVQQKNLPHLKLSSVSHVQRTGCIFLKSTIDIQTQVKIEYVYSLNLDYSSKYFGWLFFFLFNGISTFWGYLMPKASSWKNSSGSI